MHPEKTKAATFLLSKHRGFPRFLIPLLASLLLVVPLPLFGQGPLNPSPPPMPRGFPLGESYSPRKLGGGTQVWRFAQDDRGVLYAANNQTLLEFDGERWRTHEMPETRWVYSVGIDGDGSVFVGASGLLARMQPDSTGKLEAVSLMDRFDPKLAAFDRVYDVLVAPEGVYFVTRQRIFLYHREGTFQSWGSETAFWGAWPVEGRLFTPGA